jgi:hypothetical protein
LFHPRHPSQRDDQPEFLESGVLLAWPRGPERNAVVILPPYDMGTGWARPGCFIALLVMTLAAFLLVILRS